MKKKITALGLMLVAMLCMSVANAQYTYKWEVLTGTDADGGEVWTEVTDPLGTGITVQSLTKMRLTVDGAYMVKDLYSGYKYLYNSDFETKAISNSVSTKAADNVLTWDASAAYYTPDKPFTKEGTYYFVVPENGFYIYATQADYEASPKVSTKNPDKHILKVTVDNDYFIQQADCAIDVTSPVFMSFPSQFVVTLNNDNITKTALSENANIGIYSSSTLKSEFDVAISDDGKTLTLTPKTVLSSGQGLYVSILAGSLTFNDDATKTNNHLMFGPYAFPSSSSFRGTYPEAGGKTTSLDKIYAYVGSSSGTYFFDDTKSIVLKKYNAETQAYDAVCNLTPKQVDGPTSPAAQNYITLEFTPAETPAEGLTPGAYQVEIPEKAIFYEKSSGSSTYYYYLKAATYDYELAEVPNVTLTPVWSIEEGSTQKDLETLTATFAGATTARFNYMAMPQIYKKIGSSYTYVADVTLSGLSSSEFNAIGEGGVVTLTFDKLSQEGEYKIDFPAGALAFEGFPDLVSEASEIKFNIESSALAKASNVTIDPAPGKIASLPETFTLTLSNADITSVEVGTTEEYAGYDPETWESIYETVPMTATFVEVDGWNSAEYTITVDATDCKKITLTKSAESTMQLDATKSYYLQVPTGALIINKNAETGEFSTNDELNFGDYYSDYVYRWEVQTGVNEDGTAVWTEVSDPLSTGITVDALRKLRLTVDGAYQVKAFYAGYPAIYNSDLSTKLISSVKATAEGNQIVYDIEAGYYTPDKPYTVEGDYYMKIEKKGVQAYRTAEDVTNKVFTYNEDILACAVKVDNNYAVSQADCSINQEEGAWFKTMPTEYVVTINRDDITSAVMAEDAQVMLYASSSNQVACTVTPSEDGKTLTVTANDAITKSGDYYLYIIANSIQFNGDATMTNNHLKFGPFTAPSSKNIYEVLPAEDGKITKIDKFYASVNTRSGEFEFSETNPAVLNVWNETNAAWEKVCDLAASQVADPYTVNSTGYITVEYTPASTPENGFAIGKYQVAIPASSFYYTSVSSQGKVSAYTNKAYEAEYEFCEAPAVSVTPVWSIEEGSTHTGLTEAYVTFEGITTADFNSSKPIEVYKNIAGEYTYYTEANCAEFDYDTYTYVTKVEEGGKIKLTFSQALSQEGEYKINLPAGVLAFEGFADLVNEASEVSFNIESNAPIKPSNVTIDPKAGGIADFPAQFTLTIDNADITAVEVGAEEVWVGWDEDYNDIYELQTFTASLVEVGGYNSVQYDIAVDADDCKKIILTKSADNYATFDPTQKYYLEVKAGSLIVNKNAETGESLINDDLAFGMYVAMALEVTPDPEEVIYSAKDFYIKSNTESLTFANDESKPVMINYEDPEFGMISPINVTVTAVEGTTNEFLISTGMDAKQPGTYTLVIPAGSFFYNGDENQPVAESTFVYTLEVEPIDEGVTTIPAQGDLDINRVGGTFRAVNVIFPEDVMVNPDFKGEITLAIDGTQVSSINKLSSGELATELGIVFPDKFTQNGTYTVTMPRGAALYRADGRETSSQVFTWNVTGGFEKADGVTVDPAEGEVESISLVTMVFNEYEVATKNIFYNTSALAKNGNVVLRNAAGEIVASATTSEMAPSTVGYNAVEVQFCKPGTIEAIEITAPGTYTMTLPEGIINYNASGANPCECGECNACTTSRKGTGNGNYNEEMTFTWTILGDATLVATPADGETVDQLVNIILEWQGASAVTVDATLMVGGAKLYKVVEGGENEFVSDMICSPIGEGSNTAVLDIFNMPTEKGAYVVEIAEGMFTVDGTAWEAVTLNYTLGGVDVVLTDKGDAPLRKFEMTVTPCETIEVNPESSGVITLAYLESGITEVGSYTLENINGNTADLTLSTDNELADGNYVVWIPEGHLIFDGKPCADIKVYFDNVVMNGIYGISIDAKDLNIYSVNGMLIKRNGSISDLNELEPGVYIINGKKVLVK